MRVTSSVHAAALCAAFVAAPTVAAEKKTAVVPESQNWAVSDYHYSPAIRVGDTLWLSGVVAGAPEGERDAAGMQAAFERGFAAVAEVLGAAGADWDDVVEMTTFHTDLPAQIDAFSKAKDKFVEAPYPAWTAIDIDRLYPDDGLVEIKVIAVIGSGD